MSVFRNCILLTLAGAGLTSAPGHSRILRVAQDGSQEFTIIQLALDASQEGDSVVVEPGTYPENLNFSFSHNVVLMGRLGRDVTTIDGSGENEAVIRMRNGQTRATIIQGFTITRGHGSLLRPELGGAAGFGGGIFIQNAEPIIRENAILENGGEQTIWGGGIYCETRGGGLLVARFPLITGNEIRENMTSDNGGGFGSLGSVAPEITSNRFESNRTGIGDGGGIWIITARSGTRIENNVVRGNEAGDHGGGIHCVGNVLPPPDILIALNEVSGNTAHLDSGRSGAGGGIYLVQLNATVRQNTICRNSAGGFSGGAIVLDNGPGAYGLDRNIIALTSDGGGVFCVGAAPVVIESNLAWANTGGNGIGLCPNWVGEGGNIEQDPFFCDAPNDNFTVAQNSPALLNGLPIGAHEAPGCPPVAIALQATWSSIKARYLGGRR